ncbi:hypothetical protein [Nonomuraea endophytica]|uniref:hypothetical protein n=1 Tax=Nonomuraea endophytica TaxID=714136 RepID=UPI0037C79E52
MRITYPGELAYAGTGSYALLSWATRWSLRSAATGEADLLSFPAVAATISADNSTLAVAKGLISGGRNVHVYRLMPGRSPVPVGQPIETYQAPRQGRADRPSPDGTMLGCVTARWARVYDV